MGMKSMANMNAMMFGRTNMKDSKSTSGGSIGFTGLLTIAFIVLKLCNIINWSWWWVLSPLWISIGLVFAVLIVIILVALIKALVKESRDNKSNNYRGNKR